MAHEHPLLPGNVTLLRPTTALEAAFWLIVAEFAAAGEAFEPPKHCDLARDDFAAYVARLDAYARGDGLPPGHVPSSTYWLVRDATEVLGSSSLRVQLTPALEVIGGHIGYRIRPTQRRQGLGTRLLALTLNQARVQGLGRVLVTCDTANIASARVIERNGGLLDGQGVSPYDGVPISRFCWRRGYREGRRRQGECAGGAGGALRRQQSR